MLKLFASDSGEVIINEIAEKTSSIGYIVLSAFAGLVGFLLMIAAIYTGIKIVYSIGEKRKANIVHFFIILVIFVVIIIIFAIGVNFAVDISKKAASGIS
ncbi:Mbov_0395 family pilin-like conjugal transfer protein [Mycoplasma sp. 480]|uniref:Mbov_0395 family pilin-like conjugal transfer protein n=1 Tax=Mycoplasma sp. 480 TaxID=3440155 RepID=UPI003F517BF0